MIRVLLKASSAVSRAGLKSLLDSHPSIRAIEGAPGNGEDADAASVADLLLAEAETLADATARDAMDWASARGPVVLLLRNPAAEAVAEALRAGVKGVLSSLAGGAEIAAAIEAAAAGLTVLESGTMEALLPVPAREGSAMVAPLAEELSPREREVLQLVAAGLGNKEIASRLEISEHTVKFHIASVMGKLGAGSRTEAVTLGIRHGLIMI